MTSSFSNLVIAGMAIQNDLAVAAAMPSICQTVDSLLPRLEEHAQAIAARKPSRAVILGSPQLFPLAREASLKILEMTGGSCVAIAETFLGLRHGPMSFVAPDSLVLSFLSSDPTVRLYELDLLAELRAKGLGYLVGLVLDGRDADYLDERIPASAPQLPDTLRTPFEVVFAQLLAYHLSLSAGLNPDNPSPDGVITRVVGGIRIHGN
jgi:tagatose-6-phosphate ketose/aldose isomerase